MMKAKCLWTDRDTCSFRWTRDELLPPPSAHRELAFAAADGRSETRCSPLFPIRTVAGGKARVETSVWFRDAEPAVFRVDVLSVGGVCWGNFEAAVWLEAANGVMLGKKMGAANAFTIRIASKPLPGGLFGVSFWLKNASDRDRDGVWHVRRWLENKAGKKSFVWEGAEIFFDGTNWPLFQWQRHRASLLKFAAASDMFLSVEFTRSEQQPAIVEPEVVEQNGVDRVEKVDEEKTSDHLAAEMNGSGDQQAASPHRSLSMCSTATSFSDMMWVELE
ncbi:hypothetical protein M3Y99_00688700 [Aphelenchoides fujianensis]|nr:hypothetical protein M3Y99_00688700 [Aphelenchoides fujianensis]